MAQYPDAQTLIDKAHGPVLLEVHRSLRSILGMIIIFAASVAGLLLLTHYLSLRNPGETPSIGPLPVRWLAVIPLGILLEVMRRYHDDLYAFYDNRIVHQNGRLSLSYTVPAVRYVDIRAITVSQGIMARILDYGDIYVGTAAQEGDELVMTGIRSPREISKILDDLRSVSRPAEPTTNENAPRVLPSVTAAAR